VEPAVQAWKGASGYTPQLVGAPAAVWQHTFGWAKPALQATTVPETSLAATACSCDCDPTVSDFPLHAKSSKAPAPIDVVVSR
jgi:hypothetical protein